MKRESKKRKFRPWVILLTIFIFLYAIFLYFKITNVEAYNTFRYRINPNEKIFNEIIASKLNKHPLELNSKDYKKIDKLYLSGSDLKNIKPITRLKNLQTLSLSNLKINNLKPLSKLTNLKSLTLMDLDIGNLKTLSNLKQLRELDIQQVGIPYKQPSRITYRIREFLGIPIKNHDRGRKPISITPLKKLTKLEKLTIENCRVKSFKPVKKLKKLNTLHLYYPNISNMKLLSGLKNLKYLYVRDKKLTNIKYLKSLTNLERLTIKAKNINDEQICELKEALPNLKIEK
ncbi:MAG: hypothetical protein JXA96_09950 [Sedimentisphaerales bacterium]|nr:hypothetical protein [Sedimentisphaerales bacterium]